MNELPYFLFKKRGKKYVLCYGYTGHDLSAAKFKEYLLRTVMRGPDDQRVVEGPFGLMGFGRLAIMGLTPEGMQPFYRGADCVVCNGELYGFRFEKEILKRRGYKFQSDCDCEILLPLYYEYGLDMFRHMDSEFALIMYDSRKDRLIAARDPIGIRPLFYGYSKSSHQIAFASEMQNLIGWCDDIRPFPIGSYYCDGRFVRYEDIADVPAPMQDDMDTVLRNIREKLIAGVEKRLDADAPVGFLLSGGLDSSLVCSIAAKKLGKPIRTFAIGMDTDAIDLKYARQTAEYLGSEHHEIIINRDMVINSLEEVIRLLGTWDITTIRASMGMYLLCKAIHEQTDVRVLLTGEISDELFGYKYTDYAPTADAFQQESQKRIRELYMYDVLRADRCISSNSIEARVPFGDLDFVRYVMAIDPEKKLNSYGKVSICCARPLRAIAAAGDPVARKGRLLGCCRPQHGGRYQRVCRKPLHRRGVPAAPGKLFGPLHAVHQGKPVLPRNFREVLPRPEPHHRGLLDAQQGMAELQRQRPFGRVLANYGASGV
mgnify:FL=1